MHAYAIASGFAGLDGLGMHVVTIFVVATVGRRHRPDVAGIFLAWAIAGLVWMLVSYALVYGLPLLALGGGGVERYESLLAARTVLGMVVNVALTLLFLNGIVKLFQPPKGVAVEPTGPYR